MNIVRAIIAFGLFTGLGWAVWTGQFDGDSGGSSKSRALKNLVDGVTGRFGVEMTAMGLIGVGVVLALFFIMLHRRDQAYYD